MKSKRSLSLVELMLAMALFTLLTSCCFFWYRYEAKRQKIHEKWQQRVVEQERLDRKFADFFFALKNSSQFHTLEEGTRKSLIAIVDNGVDPTPLLSSETVVELTLDQGSGELLYTLWPHPKHRQFELHRTQILKTGVKEWYWEFYFPRMALPKSVEAQAVGDYPAVGWQTEWHLRYHAIPALVKLKIISMTGEESEFAYDLPHFTEAAIVE